MLPCIVTDFYFNNQPDTPIIQLLFCHKTTCFRHLLCPSSGVFYCTFGTGKFRAGFEIITGEFHEGFDHRQNLHETYQCQMYGRKLPMVGREDVRNM